VAFDRSVPGAERHTLIAIAVVGAICKKPLLLKVDALFEVEMV